MLDMTAVWLVGWLVGWLMTGWLYMNILVLILLVLGCLYINIVETVKMYNFKYNV